MAIANRLWIFGNTAEKAGFPPHLGRVGQELTTLTNLPLR